MKKKEPDPVQGYLFETVLDAESDLALRNNTVCKIIARTPDEEFNYEMGVAFIVEFSDKFRTTVYANELRPWYPAD